MARVRCITEMGMGVDVHGKDATKAAKRAVSDAIRHSSLGFFRMLGKTANDMFVDVTIGAPNPDAVDKAAVAKEPKNAVAHYSLGNALGDDGKLPEAIAEWEACVKLAPDTPQAKNAEKKIELAKSKSKGGGAPPATGKK